MFCKNYMVDFRLSITVYVKAVNGKVWLRSLLKSFTAYSLPIIIMFQLLVAPLFFYSHMLHNVFSQACLLHIPQYKYFVVVVGYTLCISVQTLPAEIRDTCTYNDTVTLTLENCNRRLYQL